MRNYNDEYLGERGLIVVQDESGREVATLLAPQNATPASLGPKLKRIGGHFYYPPSWAESNEARVDGAVWSSTQDFAAWLTGYLKFFGTRRARVQDRTNFKLPSSIELLPTGARPANILYTYVLGPKVSRTKPGIHVNLIVLAHRYDGRVNEIFNGNLHKFMPIEVQGRGYSFIELGR